MLTVASSFLTACNIDYDAMDEIPESKKEFAMLEDFNYEFSEFTKIRVDTNSKLDISVGGEQFVTIATQPEHIDHITTEVKDGELIIKHIGDHQYKGLTSIEIGVANLEAIDIDALIVGEAYGIDSSFIEIKYEGIGEMDISGKCDEALITVDGIGDFSSKDLLCKHVEADVSGIGSTKIYASQSIDIDGGGIGDVSVYGDPEDKTVSFSGIGEFSFK